MLFPVIMAGGSGTRLWPLSRKSFPKQFLNLNGDLSMLQTTAKRLQHLEHMPPMVICNEEHRFTVAEQLRLSNIDNSGIILEPIGRNTAPTVALAAFSALKNCSDPLLLVLAADHVIKNEAAFTQAIKNAITFAEQDKLVTFGIVPSSPETGYGYVMAGNAIDDNSFTVEKFVEKPNLETAEEYVESGKYYWNSGIFIFKARRYLAELKQFRPDIFTVCEQASKQISIDADFIRIDKDTFSTCPEASIDYAVMEHTKDAVVVPMDCEWNDIGSWSALWEISNKDKSDNAIRGDVIALDTTKSFIYAQNKLVTTIGLDDVVIIETKDALLVAKQSEVQQVKQIVAQLEQHQRSEFEHHRDVYRPWGKYDSLDAGERFQVKRITVKPGGKLSIQMHHHRAEHWIVVAGTAKVTNGDKEMLVTENQSTYIPIGAVHALENPGKVPLELIEVQSGSYLGEDDIVRFKDIYGRI